MKALLLLAFGGPRSFDEVEFFNTSFPGSKTFSRTIGKNQRALPIDWRFFPSSRNHTGTGQGIRRKLNEKGINSNPMWECVMVTL